MQPHHDQHRPEACSVDRLVPALVVIGVGLYFLLNTLHIFAFRDILQYWPAAVVALGLVKLLESEDSCGRTGGGVLVAAGGLMLARNLGFLHLLRMREMWPLILIGIGLWMLVQRTEDPHVRR